MLRAFANVPPVNRETWRDADRLLSNARLPHGSTISTANLCTEVKRITLSGPAQLFEVKSVA
jgi:hypothetical protein